MSADTTVTEEDTSQARAKLVRYGRAMAADRLAVGSAGNLSIRLGDTVVMTPTGVNYDLIGERNICVLDAEGALLDGEGARSSEWPMHRKIYDLTGAEPWCTRTRRSRWRCPRCATRSRPSITRCCAWAARRCGSPRTPRSARTAWPTRHRAALDGRFAALLQNHGAVAYGASIDEAYDRALLLEWLAEVYWRARLAGSPRILSDAELDAVREAARQHRYRSGGA